MDRTEGIDDCSLRCEVSVVERLNGIRGMKDGDSTRAEGETSSLGFQGGNGHLGLLTDALQISTLDDLPVIVRLSPGDPSAMLRDFVRNDS